MIIKRGFTLVELLTTLFILMVVSSVVFPTIAAAKKEAFKVEETSHLRQIGIAQTLYISDSDSMITRLEPLVKNGYMSSNLLWSNLDSIPEGTGNLVSKSIALNLPHVKQLLPWRTSFTSFSSYGYFEEKYSEIIEKPAVGWLVSLTQCQSVHPGAEHLRFGPFRRLTTEASIIRSTAGWMSGQKISEIEIGRIFHPKSYFYDMDSDELKAELVDGE